MNHPAVRWCVCREADSRLEEELERRDEIAAENRCAVTTRAWRPGDPIGPFTDTSVYSDELGIEDEPHDVDRDTMFDADAWLYGPVGWGYRD